MGKHITPLGSGRGRWNQIRKVVMLSIEEKLQAHMILLVEQDKRIKRLEEALENLEGFVKGEVRDGIKELLKKSYERLSD